MASLPLISSGAGVPPSLNTAMITGAVPWACYQAKYSLPTLNLLSFGPAIALSEIILIIFSRQKPQTTKTNDKEKIQNNIMIQNQLFCINLQNPCFGRLKVPSNQKASPPPQKTPPFLHVCNAYKHSGQNPPQRKHAKTFTIIYKKIRK
eukprot:TRINITY_DN7456_c1_g1_i11.p1 TRINITY_DN7456_c1_g1~~TRINITY_DN7456_c1_g1_i11.p1  ORF type:complete len:158 (+),score=4.43 TRINITY_DN7456_c1_g1_i11:29-475(+)